MFTAIPDEDGNVFVWKTVEEEWREIPGKEGRYAVSNYGEVYSIPRKVRCQNHLRPIPGGMKSVFLNHNGYPSVNIKDIGKPKKVETLHALVATTFIGPRPKGMDICHNDGNRLNPHLDNLRYDTRAGNVADTIKHGTLVKGEMKANSVYTEQQVREAKRLLNSNSIAQTAAVTGINKSTIASIKRNCNWAHVSV